MKIKHDFDICVAQFTLYSRRYQWNEGEEKSLNILTK